MKRIPVCCSHAEHQNPRRNSDGWILTGIPHKEEAWEAFLQGEWDAHCAHAAAQARSDAKRKRSAA